MESREEILTFWFGELGEDGFPQEDRRDLWFGSDPDTDREISERFGPRVERAARGKYDTWRSDPRGRLALILLLDQFPRNIHRGTPGAFAHDAQSLALVLEGLERGQDGQLAPAERVFFYLPLEHSEDPQHQERSVALFRELLEGTEDREGMLREALDYAEKHRDLIHRFGRFPHRNRVLARRSTPEEREYLESSAETFGQG